MENYQVAIIDGDSIAWIIGYRHKDNQLEGMVIEDVDTFIRSLVSATGVSYIAGYLGNDTKTSFRRDLVATYKSNRPDTPDWYKTWGKVIDNHLIVKWGFARSPDGYEADDCIAAAAASTLTSYVICGVDKDLKQIPGAHYNYNKNEFATVTSAEGRLALALQAITGDSTDGIKGIPGHGPKKAEKVLKNTPEDMSLLIPVLNEYISIYGEDEGVKQFYQNYMQVKLHADIPDFERTKVSASGLDFTIPAAPEEIAITSVKSEEIEYETENLFKVAS